MVKWLKRIISYLIIIVLAIFIFIFIKMTFIGKNVHIPSFQSYILTSTNKKNVQLSFLGTSCFVINYHGKQFMSDPFFSNPSIPSTILGNMKLQPINKYINDSIYNNVEMVSVSHGHYDHCLDIGQVLQSFTKVIADSSVMYQMHPVLKDDTNLAALDFVPYTNWIYSADSTFRVFPILSTHGPHIGNIVFFSGCYEKPQNQFPKNLFDWKLGKGNYSFLVDVMNNDSIVFRMALLYGNINNIEQAKIKAIYAQQKCDVLSCVFWKKTQNEPQLKQAIAITNAEQIVLNHWNNFFRSNDKSLQYFRSSQILEELKILNDKQIPAKIMLPFTSVDL